MHMHVSDECKKNWKIKLTKSDKKDDDPTWRTTTYTTNYAKNVKKGMIWRETPKQEVVIYTIPY